MTEEVTPPWVTHPAYGPADFFWREAGQPWFTLVWEPYWKSLTPQAVAAYLHRWQVPDAWRHYYFDTRFRDFLNAVDEP